MIDEALEIAGTGAGLALAPELFLLKGDLLQALPDREATEAQAWFRRAHDVARDLDARMPQLRAAIRLSRYAQKSGDDRGRPPRPTAVAELRAVFDTFSEGFSTADLIEGKDLLETNR